MSKVSINNFQSFRKTMETTMNEINFKSLQNICRTCLRSSNRMYLLSDDVSLINKIEVISSVQISLENEYLPNAICDDCLNNVNHFYYFQKMIINSEKELTERLSSYQMNKIDIIEDDFKFNENNEKSSEQNEHSNDKKFKKNRKDVRKKIKIEMKNKFCCIKCDEAFATRADLKCHKRKSHFRTRMCNVCGVTIRCDNLSKHMSTHCDKTVSCDICKKILKNKESLRGHLLLHKNVTFTCDICGRISKVKSEHTRHIKQHNDPDCRKVECSLCGKKVRDLKKHMISHTGERPYICNYCNKGFGSPYGLKVHTRQHKNEKPFVCEYCSMAFYQKASLLTHLKSKHDV